MNADLPTVVLVHGAWQSAATWDLLVPRLQAAGCRVEVAALTGLEDSSQLNADVTLDTHVSDVVRTIDEGDLRDISLVGHSYAGMIVTGVAERAEGRLRRLVYVDAFVPRDGDSALQLMPEPLQLAFRERAASDNGWRLRASEQHLDLWGLPAGQARDFVRSRMTDFSLRCFEAPVAAPSAAASRIGSTYVACTRRDYPARAVFERFAREASAAGWPCHEVPTGHDVHVEAPERLAAILLDASESSGSPHGN